MYKLLVVDDEYQTRKGLSELPDWQELNVSVAGEASDGDEALELLEQLKPDLLMTDVRMHRMDGLELARRARELFPDLGIIFISGYSDAEYLQNALRIGASDYIYKPIHLDELKKAVRKLTAQMDQLAEMHALVENSKPLLAERFLRSWFFGQMEDKQFIRSKLQLLDLRFPDAPGIFAAAFFPAWETFPQSGVAEKTQIQLERIIRTGMKNILTCAEDTGVLALLSDADGLQPAEMENQLKAIGAEAQRVLQIPVLIGISNRHDDWLDAPIAVQEAMQTIACQVFPDENNVLHYEPETPEILPSFYHLDGDLMERYLISGNLEMLQQMMDEAFHEAAQNLLIMRKIAMSIMLRVDLALNRQGIDSLDSLAFCRQAMSSHSRVSITNSLHSLLREACGMIQSRSEQSYSTAVMRIMEMIQSNYAEHLSVNSMAEQVHYSPAHLSTLFKKDTGMTLSEAILRTRIKAAMDLLRTTLEPVSAIASKVGYADVQYFSRAFKQFTGYTPLEYRRKVLL